MIEEKVFRKEKAAVIQKITNEAISDLKFTIGQEGDDFMRENLTVMLSASIYTHLAEERELVYDFDRPTFTDWLLRRKRKAKFNLKVKDLLLILPISENSLRMYVTEKQ